MNTSKENANIVDFWWKKKKLMIVKMSTGWLFNDRRDEGKKGDKLDKINENKPNC